MTKFQELAKKYNCSDCNISLLCKRHNVSVYDLEDFIEKSEEDYHEQINYAHELYYEFTQLGKANDLAKYLAKVTGKSVQNWNTFFNKGLFTVNENLVKQLSPLQKEFVKCMHFALLHLIDTENYDPQYVGKLYTNRRVA